VIDWFVVSSLVDFSCLQQPL